MASILDSSSSYIHELIDSLYLEVQDKELLHRMWDAYADVYFDLYLQAHQINNSKSVMEMLPFLFRWQINGELKYAGIAEDPGDGLIYKHDITFPANESNIVLLGNMESWWEKEVLDNVSSFATGYGSIIGISDTSVDVQYHSITDLTSCVEYAIEHNSPDSVKYENATIAFGSDNFRGTEVYNIEGTGALAGPIAGEVKASTLNENFTLATVGDHFYTSSGYQVTLIESNSVTGKYKIACSSIAQHHKLSHIAFTLPGVSITSPGGTGTIQVVCRKNDTFQNHTLEGGQKPIYSLYDVIFKEEKLTEDPRQWIEWVDSSGNKENKDFLEYSTDYRFDEDSGTIYASKIITNEQVLFKDNLIDLMLPYNNFGFLVNFRGQNSQQYLDRLQAIWYALWHTPSPYNMTVGCSALIDSPLANEKGIVTLVDTSTKYVEITKLDGKIESHHYDPLHSPIVVVGQTVEEFQPLTDEVVICDHIKYPYWWRLNYRGPHWDDKSITLDTYIDPKPRTFDAKLTNEELLKDLRFRLHIFGVFMKIKALQDGSAELVEEFLLFYKATYTHFIIRAEMLLNDEMPINDDDLRFEITDKLEDIFWCFPHWDNVHSYGDLDKTLTFDDCHRDTLQIFVIENSYRLYDKFWKAGYLDDPADEFDDPDALLDDTFDHDNETMEIRIMDLDNGLYRFYDSMYGEVHRELAEDPDRFDLKEALDDELDLLEPTETLDDIAPFEEPYGVMDDTKVLTWTALRDTLEIQIIDA